ncbi:alpha/beta hydrolase family protein [Paludisphaera rhizosphaerae]|uniref:hypothetical protein n=1 Tax=Paludisphaera rhizosphaerae TaxID=2711216 RepID=UPI0013EB35B6|nr:hypothetical protein [Paludisphaera rhizosphaerae]
MPRIVMVHGIDNQNEGEDLIRSSWIDALAGGLRLVDREDLADRLKLPSTDPSRIDVRVAFYGHLFRAPDVQGDPADLDDLTPAQAATAEALAAEWLGRVAERAPAESPSAVQAERALAMTRNSELVQGAGNLLRATINTLARFPFFARPTLWLAERTVITTLRQVTLYLTEPALRKQIRGIVLGRVDDDTTILIGHSLGSVVAYECAHRLPAPLPLLTTIGSPLGLRTIVTERLDPSPSFPPLVQSWLNHANLEDVVAAEPDLTPLFGRDVPAASRLTCSHYQEAGNAHRSETYLGREIIARAVAEALR